jgi:hypothetical protein
MLNRIIKSGNLNRLLHKVVLPQKPQAGQGYVVHTTWLFISWHSDRIIIFRLDDPFLNGILDFTTPISRDSVIDMEIPLLDHGVGMKSDVGKARSRTFIGTNHKT